LLQIVDPGKSGPVGARATTASTSTTSTTRPRSGSTTSTTKKAVAQKTPAQVHLLVLNSGAATGAAGHVATNLRNKGYTNQGTPSNNATKIIGVKVECLPGLSREQAALVTLLNPGATQATLAAPLPTGAAGYECVVLVGSG
jgi:hypothetical protein